MGPRGVGLVLIVGSVLFTLAAFNPSSRVFGEPTAEGRLAVISSAPWLWTLSQVLFSAGSVVTVVGVAAMAVHLRALAPGAVWSLLVGVLALGALLWTGHVVQRALDPAAFAHGQLPSWPFVVYTFGTQLSLGALGALVLRSPLPGWVGWLLIGSMALFLILTLVFRDMPPFVYYVVTFVLGVVLMRGG